MSLDTFLGTNLSFRAVEWTHEILDEELEQGRRRLAFTGKLEPRYDLQDYEGTPVDKLPVTFYVHSRPEAVPRESAIGGFNIVDGDIYTDVVVDPAVYESIRTSLADPGMEFEGFNITVYGLPDEETGKTAISFAGNNPIRFFKAVFKPSKGTRPQTLPQAQAAPPPVNVDPILARLNILIAFGAGILAAALL